MQEEINHKTITVYIKGAKVTANSLKAALRAVLRAREKRKQNVQRQEAAYQEDDVAVNRGKQSLRELQTEGGELSNIEIIDENIKSFERYARKYGIDYALKKDKAADPPRYFVFFRARDVKTMEAAFKEYFEYTTKEKKPSVKKKLSVAMKRTLPQRAGAREEEREERKSLSNKKKKQGKRKPRWLPRLPLTFNAKQVVIGLLPYILIAWVGDKMGWLYRRCPGNNLLSRLVVLLSNAQMAFGRPLVSFHPRDLLVGLASAVAVRLVVAYRASNSKKFRHGREYGSARWGTPKDIAPFIDPVYENNIILTATERLTMNGRSYLPKYARNKNVIVIGGPGSGKTRFFVKPNLMQMPEKVSFVVTDPKGSLIIECGRMLVRGGYRVKVLNTINFAKSMHYNPFQYILSEKDILKLVNALIANTKGDGDKAGEDFWVKSERLLFCALIGYLWYEAPEDEQNFTMLLELINAFEVREEDETFKNAIDLLFDDLARDKPDHFAVRQYAKFKLAAGKTAKSIVISCGARLAPFDIAELRDLLAYDEMELDMIGDQHTALFIIVSDTDSTFNFVVAMMYSQLFNLLCDRADDVHGGRLPYRVLFLLDEFANIGKTPMFDKLIATIRSREMSANIILQSQSQLKTIYKDAAETIIGNCDTMLFLGGKEPSTLKEISETLGKETIDLYNTSDTRGQSRSMGLNYQKTGHELMSRDELAVMDGNKCILQLRGVRPFLSDKYDITRHKRYRMLSDANSKNAFHIETYLRHKLHVRSDEVKSEFVCKIPSCIPVKRYMPYNYRIRSVPEPKDSG